MSESFFSFCRGCVFHSLRYLAPNPCSTHGKLGNLVPAKLRFFPKMPNDSMEKATMFCIFIHFAEGYVPGRQPPHSMTCTPQDVGGWSANEERHLLCCLVRILHLARQGKETHLYRAVSLCIWQDSKPILQHFQSF